MVTLDVESQVDGDDEHSTHDDANDDNHDRVHAVNTLYAKSIVTVAIFIF